MVVVAAAARMALSLETLLLWRLRMRQQLVRASRRSRR